MNPGEKNLGSGTLSIRPTEGVYSQDSRKSPQASDMWLLDSDKKGAELVEAVVWDVHLAEAHVIDRRIRGSRLSS